METQKLTQEEIQWMKVNMKEVVSEMRTQSQQIKNFHLELKGISDRKEYQKRFDELFKRELKRNDNGRKNN